jgi:hypothetical protein
MRATESIFSRHPCDQQLPCDRVHLFQVQDTTGAALEGQRFNASDEAVSRFIISDLV